MFKDMGFYPQNIWIVLVLLLPNIFFALFSPINIPTENTRPDYWKIVIIIEQIGRVGIFLLPLFFKVSIDTDMKEYALIAMIVFIALYYICWIRYFANGREFSLLYKNFLLIPIPMAIFPILYCFAVGMLLNSWMYAGVTLLFAIGHIMESWYIGSHII